MFWVWLACAALAGIGGGVFLGLKAATILMQPAMREQRRNMAGDRNFSLSVLRRELANWMFRRDPDRYRRAYKAALEAAAVVAAADPAEKCRQLAELTQRYPFYTDFDLLGSRDYILYSDSLSTNSYDSIEHHYTDIIRFQVLQAAIDEDWPGTGAISDPELEHLDSYAQSFKDTLFKARMEQALGEFQAYRRGKGDLGAADTYETSVLAVRPVAHFAEVRYGIHFKDTNEFGLYGAFVDDDPEKIFRSFYRSNAGFTEESILDDWRINVPL